MVRKNIRYVELAIALFTLFEPIWFLFSKSVNMSFRYPILPIYTPMGFILSSFFYMGTRFGILSKIVCFILILMPLVLPFVKNAKRNYIMLWTVLILNCVIDIFMLFNQFAWNQKTYSLLFNFIVFLILGIYTYKYRKKNSTQIQSEQSNIIIQSKQKKLHRCSIIIVTLATAIVLIFLLDSKSSSKLYKLKFSDRENEIARVGYIDLNSDITTDFADDTIVYYDRSGPIEIGNGKGEIPGGKYIFIDNGNHYNYLYIRNSKNDDLYSKRYGYGSIILLELKEGEWMSMENGALIAYNNKFIDKQNEFGVFEVGKDIEPGNYKLQSLYEKGAGSYCIYSSDNFNLIIEEDIQKDKSINLEEGQILTISNIIISYQ